MRRAFLLAFLITGCGDNSSNNEMDLATENPDFGGMDDLAVGSDLSNPPDLTSTGQDGNMLPDDGGQPQPIKWSARRFGGDHWGVAYGNGKFVAATTSAMTLNSTDGATWTPSLLPIPGGLDLMSIGYVNGQFWVIDSSPALRTSTDGTTWTDRQLTSAFTALKGVGYNGTAWVAVGDKMNASTDLSSWTDVTPGMQTQTMEAAAALGTKLIVVGDSGQGFSSTNGTTWTIIAMGDTNNYYSLSCTSTLCVAVGDLGIIRTSTDGANWTMRDSKIVDNSTLWSVTRLGTTWVASGENGHITTSPDGITWTLQTTPVTTTLYGVAASSTTLAAVGSTATRISSANGTAWTDHTFAYNSLTLATDGTTLVAVGGTEALHSADGTTFTAAAAPFAVPVQNVSYAGGLFFALGDSNGGAPALFSSSDSGVTWTRRINDDASGAHISGVAKGATVYLAVGGDGNTPATWLSTNGTTWTKSTLAAFTNSASFSGVAFGNGLFVATDDSNGTVYTSTDGITWTDRNVTSSGLSAVGYANSVFVAVGANAVVVSPDGMSWTPESDPNGNHGYAVTYGAGTWLDVGNTGLGGPAEMIVSTDVVNWVDQSGAVNVALGGAVYFGGMYYASGDAELIIAGK
jgi:hypothetical protein